MPTTDRAASLARALPLSALLAPAFAFVLVSAGILVLGAFGAHPFWRTEQVSLSEAAGSRDDAQALRLIMAGSDPNARYAVRRDFIDTREHQITPLEAAVRVMRPPTVELLLFAGARPDEATWRLANCLPEGSDREQIVTLLAPYAAASEVRCPEVPAP